MKTIQYGVWEADEEYWAFFDSVEDAVSAHGDGTEVYRLEAKYYGRFKRAVTLSRLKKRKKRSAKRK